ncbi:hypothetical protein EJB05_46304, partial [Eragrostis curvula]
MSDPGGSSPERRQRRRNEAPPDPKAAAAISVAKVFGNRDLLGEILLRVDSPTWLVRAAVASKCFLRVASDPAFLDSFRARHPPRILGLSVIGIRSSPRLLPFPQPPELAAAAGFAGRALGYLGRDDRCSDYCNGRLLIEMTGNRDWLRYDVSSLYHVGRHRILPPLPPLGSGDEEPGLFYSQRLFLFEDDATSCLSLSMACDTETVRANFSILRDGVWGFQQSAVRELEQDPYQTVLGHKLLSGGKVYMMTTAGCILALNLATATFSALELPDGAERSASLRLSRAQQSGFYLIYTTGFLLRVWHSNGVGQWVLVDTISVYEACANLNVRKWVPDDEYTSPVCIVGVGDNAEFVILELVASGIVCCMQRDNRVVEKVAEGLMQICGPSARPITMALNIST